MKVIVNISDMAVTNRENDVLITYALGSCIGLAVFDKKNMVGGMIHYQLSDSSIDKSPDLNICKYADTGIPYLFQQIEKLGGKIDNLIVKAAGGAVINLEKDIFQIGRKNYIALRKILWQYNLFLDGEDTGGKIEKNLVLEMATGKAFTKSRGVVKIL